MARRSASTLRQLHNAECAYVLFIDGIQYAFATEHEDGALLGTGSGSWIYASSQDISGKEATHNREVLPGLLLPSSFSIGELELDDGQLRRGSVNFEIQDLGGTVLDLFSTENKPYDVLGQDIAAGTSNLGTSYTGSPQSVTINPQGRYIDLERIGSGGQRRVFPFIPDNDLVGYSHITFPGGDSGIPDEIRVSDDPILWEGRLCALYRIYRDPEGDNSGISDWTLWGDAYDAGDLVWWGVCRGIESATPWGKVRISCFGPEGLLSRKLGTLCPTESYRVQGGPLSLDADERGFAVWWTTLTGSAGSSVLEDCNSSIFNNDFSSSYDNHGDLADRIQDVLEDSFNNNTANGTSGNNYTTGTFTSASVAQSSTSINLEAQAGLRYGNQNSSGFYIGIADTTGLNEATLQMRICMHEKVWRFLGYEPLVQNASVSEDFTHFPFEYYSNNPFDPLPGDTYEYQGNGYWVAIFDTRHAGVEDWNNNGNPITWRPLSPDGTHILNRTGEQLVGIDMSTVDVIPQKTITYTEEAETAFGAAPTGGRVMVFKGQIRRAPEGATQEELNEVEAEDIYQVAQVSYRRLGGIGRQLYIERWLDPRMFGFSNPPLDRDWQFSASDSGIECKFLNCYTSSPGRPDNAFMVFMQMMLSTGAATGYSGAESDGAPPSFTDGPNSLSGSDGSGMYGDTEIGDLGLAIPSSMVQSYSSIQQAFSSVDGGYEGPMNIGKVFYNGPFDSGDFFKELMATRRLIWSLNGKRYGLRVIENFSIDDADISISENDLVGRVGDPTDVMPEQSFIYVGPVDKTMLRFGKSAWDNEFSHEREYPSRDRGARYRSGVRTIELSDPLLQSPENFVGASIGSRYEDVFGPSWDRDLRNLWTREVPGFMASTHYVVDVSVCRVKGQDIMPGTIIRFSNPWVIGRNGERGVSEQVALCLGVRFSPRDESYKVTMMLFGGQQDSPRFFAPIAKVLGVSGSTIYLEGGWGLTGLSDEASMFIEPSFSTAGGEGSVYIFDQDGNTTSNYTVASVDSVNNTITVTGGPITGTYRDKHKWVVFAPYGDHGSTSWARAYTLVTTDDDGTFDSGGVNGWRMRV